ncbi:MAG: SPOR domain-containing protein [Rickettsiaceae bacterium]|nr:SPOR domain-containing protein [Rickettsiaceae bacterium]
MKMRRRHVISLGILVLTGLMLMLYVLRPLNNEIPILQADEGDTKTRPLDSGGVVIPYSDNLVYDKLHSKGTKPDQIHLSPEPEKPITIEHSVEQSSRFLDSIDAILANIEHYEKELLESSDGNDNSDYIIPNKLLSKEEANRGESESEFIYLPGTKLKIIKSIEDRYKVNSVNVVSQEVKGYKLQLSSAHSEEDARKQWSNIQQKYAKILLNAHFIVKKIEGKNNRIFYLVMAGTYPSLNHAKLVCKRLNAKKQNCIVTR